MGAISPPSGDFSEPVTSHTKRYVKAFWALDVKRAQARFYPAIHPLQSYAEDAREFAPWWAAQGNGQWLALRRRFLTLLDEQAQLERMARIIGKDALPARQQLTLLCAELVNEAFLRQSAFSEIDRVCSPARQAAMMRLLGRFIDLAEAALAAGATPERIAAHRLHARRCSAWARRSPTTSCRASPNSRRAWSASSRSIDTGHGSPRCCSRLKAPPRGSKARCCSCGARSTSACTTRSRCAAATAARGSGASRRSTSSS